MKKHVLLASALMASIGMYAQNGKIIPSNAVPVNMAEKEIKKMAIVEENKTNQVITKKHAKPLPPKGAHSPSSNQKVAVVSATRFSGSRNAYGVLVSQQKPLQYNSDIDIVTFVHRVSTYFTTAPADNSGSIGVSWSLNHGTNWDSTCIWADGTNLARYPQGGIYNPPGNTNENNIYFVGTGPVTNGSGWVGNWYASKAYTASVGGNNTALGPPSTTFIPSAYGGSKQDMVRYMFTYTNDGLVRAAGPIVNDMNATTNAGYSPRGMAIMKGTFAAGSFNWTLDSLIFPVEYSSANGNALLSTPLMAWDNNGTTGYAVMLGVRQGATGTMKGIQPIVYKTTNGGASWTLIPPFDFTTLNQVDNRLPVAVQGGTFAVPFFSTNEGVDVTVDAMGRLHLVGTVVSAYSTHNDSLFYTYAFNSGGGCGSQNYSFYYGTTTTHPTIMDFILDGSGTSWNGIVVDSMATEGPDDANTCSQWSGATLTTDARIQISRNDAADKIFYSWTETDTSITGHHFNVYPDLYMKGYDIYTNTTTNKTLVIGTGATSPTVAAYGIFWHYMSNRAINVGGGTYEIPFTFSGDATFGGTTPLDHYYVSGAVFTMADYTNPELPLSAGKSNSAISKNTNVSVNAYPNPTNNNTQLVVNLDKASDIHIEILNTLGQVINSMNIKGDAGQHIINVDLSNENAGIYFYNVTTNAGKVTGKLIKE